MEQWTDHKRYLWLFGLVVPAVSLHGRWPGHPSPGASVFWFIGPIYPRPHPRHRPLARPASTARIRPTTSSPPSRPTSTLRWITYFFPPAVPRLSVAGWAGDTHRRGGQVRTRPDRGHGCRGRHQHRRMNSDTGEGGRFGWPRSRSPSPSTDTSNIEHNRGHHVPRRRPPSTRRAAGPGESLLRLPASRRGRQPAERLASPSNPASNAATRATGRSATTCSTPG